MDYEEADKSMQARVDAWADEVEAERNGFDALASLEASTITNLAYEARDLSEVAEAMIDLADELWDMGHDGPALVTLAAARATQKAAYRIGAIDG